VCSSDTVFDYLFENLKVDSFERNIAGENPLTLCKNHALLTSPKRVAKIEEVQALYDQSGKKTDDLMNELQAEEDRQKKLQQKKKEKKHKGKLNKLAAANNCTVDQLEQVFKEREEKKQ